MISSGWHTPPSLESWGYYATNVKYNGVVTTIVSGSVSECSLQGVLLYRYESSALDANGYPAEDAYYENFDGTTLTGQLAVR